MNRKPKHGDTLGVRNDQRATKEREFRSEWDFDKVPPGERQACFLYEYGREVAKRSPRILGLLAQLKKAEAKPKGHSDRKKLWGLTSEFCDAFEKCFSVCLPISSEFFPGTPWRKLEDQYRLRMLNALSRHVQGRQRSSDPLSLDTLRELERSGEHSFRVFRFVHETLCQVPLEQTEYGFFAINWDYGKSDIKRAFEKWLAEQLKEREARGCKQAGRKPPSRGGFADKLRWLGAMRVAEHYPRKELVDYPDSNLKVDAPYCHAPDLFENAKKARTLIDDLSRLTSVGVGLKS
jgi:hypothetical protein